jgi:hypothetical protein
LVLLTLALTARPSDPASPTPSPAEGPKVIPVEISNEKVFVKVRVNGAGPFGFILDTGAGGNVLSRGPAEKLGLRIEGEKEGHFGAGEGVRMKQGWARGVTLDVHGIRLTPRAIHVLPLNHVSEYEGRSVGGLLGFEFLSRYVVEIDYGGKVVRLHDPATFTYDGPGPRIPFRLLGHLVVVRAAVTVPDRSPIEADMVVDTGARTAVIFNRPFGMQGHLVQSIPKSFAGTVGGGAGGECRGLVGRLEAMRIGPLRLNRPVAIFSLDRAGVLASRGFSGIIGGPVLRRCRVFFHYPKKTLILEPAAKVPAPYEYDMSGLFLVAEGGDFDRIRVKSVLRGSPAAVAGIRRGDVIEKIDGRKAGAFPLDALRQRFREEGRRFTLQVRRGEEIFGVSFVTRRIV